MKLRSKTINSTKITNRNKKYGKERKKNKTLIFILNAIGGIVAEDEKENEYDEKCISSLLHSS